MNIEYNKNIRTQSYSQDQGYLTKGSSTNKIYVDSSSITDAGSVASYTAHALPGYQFSCWKSNSKGCVSSDSVLNLKVIQDTSLYAYFVDIPLYSKNHFDNKLDGTVVDTTLVVGRDTATLYQTLSGRYDLYRVVRYRNGSSGSYTTLDSVLVNANARKYTAWAATISKSGILKSRGGKTVKLDRTKQSDIQVCVYQFDGTTYKNAKCGTYTSIFWKYPVTFAKADGSVITSGKYAYNTTVTIPTGSSLGIPAGSTDIDYDYHWVNKANSSQTIASTTTTVSVTDTLWYNLVLDTKYRISFVDYDGTSLQANFIAQGKNATAPANPNHKGNTTDYLFYKWSDTYVNVGAPKTITALYKSRVTFKNDAGTTISTQWIETGKAATAPAAPTVSGYVFSGWDKDFSDVSDSMTVTATYVAVPSLAATYTGLKGGNTAADVKFAYDNSCVTLSSTNVYARSSATDNTALAEALSSETELVNEAWYMVGGTFLLDTVSAACQEDELVKQIVELREKAVASYAVLGYINGKLVNTDVALTATDNGIEFSLSTPKGGNVQASNTFTVTFINTDETVISTKSYDQDAAIVLPEESEIIVPTATAAYTYSFKGWEPAVPANATADGMYTALLDSAIKSYEVTFMNGDETVETQSVNYGSAATAPAAPAKSGFVFTGWDKEFDNIVAQTTVKAQFRAVPVVNFTADIEAGKKVPAITVPNACFMAKNVLVYDEADEEILSSEDGFKMVTGDKYILKFRGSMDNTEDCAENALVKEIMEVEAYVDAVIPVKVNGTTVVANIKGTSSKYDISFAFTAAAPSVFTITFKNADGTVISEVETTKNATPVAPTAELPKNTEQYTYSFGGWKPAIVAATADAEYVAIVNTTLNKYMVTFFDADGETKLSDGEVDYGVKPTAPEASEVTVPENTAQYTYGFGGWSPAVEAVTGATNYTAIIDSVLNKYVVKFFDVDGETEITGSEVEYGTVPTAPEASEVTVPENTAQYTFSFKGWDSEVVAVTEAANYIAVLDSAINHYNVTFLDYDDSKIGEVQSIAYGSAAEAPKDPERKGYKFTGWDKEFDNIVADLTVKAQYEEIKSSSSTAKSSSSTKKSSSSTAKSSSSTKKSSSSTAKSSSSTKKSSSSTAKSSSSDKKDAIMVYDVPTFHVSVNGRNLSVFGASVGSKMAVLDLQGRVISVGRVDAANFNVTLPRAGMYVVRIDNQVKKVSVR
ncbi:MAG: InlB B-repeat-containing protein [Fibrobacter sp.]|nr:InlB B-repeat-containing protein [Fibrobacter sp.]